MKKMLLAGLVVTMGIIFATNFTTAHKQADSVPIFPKPFAGTTK